jgi:hypothetical protein
VIWRGGGGEIRGDSTSLFFVVGYLTTLSPCRPYSFGWLDVRSFGKDRSYRNGSIPVYSCKEGLREDNEKPIRIAGPWAEIRTDYLSSTSVERDFYPSLFNTLSSSI